MPFVTTVALITWNIKAPTKCAEEEFCERLEELLQKEGLGPNPSSSEIKRCKARLQQVRAMPTNILVVFRSVRPWRVQGLGLTAPSSPRGRPRDRSIRRARWTASTSATWWSQAAAAPPPLITP